MYTVRQTLQMLDEARAVIEAFDEWLVDEVGQVDQAKLRSARRRRRELKSACRALNRAIWRTISRALRGAKPSQLPERVLAPAPRPAKSSPAPLTPLERLTIHALPAPPDSGSKPAPLFDFNGVRQAA
jgi:hypothetical protein